MYLKTTLELALLSEMMALLQLLGILPTDCHECWCHICNHQCLWGQRQTDGGVKPSDQAGIQQVSNSPLGRFDTGQT